MNLHDVDLRYIPGPAYTGPRLKPGTDIWGVKRTRVSARLNGGTEIYEEVEQSPLAAAATVKEIKDYAHWPSPDWFDYSAVESQCDEIRARGRVVVFMGDRLNRVAQLKPAMYLRGLEQIFMDTAMRPEIAHAVFARIREFYSCYLQRILQAAKGKLDIVLTGDDFGSQNGLLISPDMWRAFIKPGFAEYVGLIKNHNTKVMHHTCGSVVELIPDLIECGLDVLQSVQPEAANMSLADLMATFGDQICFHGGISIQRTMPFGAPDDIRTEVRNITDLVKTRGGYVLCTSHNIQADTSVANVQALMRAFLEYGAVA
ncbi:uroporphyrinogen decarboxylase family protein [Verrucomicrobiota bacterium]